MITITEDTRQILPAFARRKATVITQRQLVVDASAFDPVEPITPPDMNSLLSAPVLQHKPGTPIRLLYIGRMLEWKGVMLMLRALKQLNGKLTYEFTMMGEGPARKVYEAYVRKHGLNVTFVSPNGIPRRKLSTYYLSHDLFVFPGLHGTGGYVMVEAQLHGLPVLMLDITAPACFKQEETDVIIDTKDKTIDQIVDIIAQKMLLLAGAEQTLINPLVDTRSGRVVFSTGIRKLLKLG